MPSDPALIGCATSALIERKRETVKDRDRDRDREEATEKGIKCGGSGAKSKYSHRVNLNI